MPRSPFRKGCNPRRHYQDSPAYVSVQKASGRPKVLVNWTASCPHTFPKSTYAKSPSERTNSPISNHISPVFLYPPNIHPHAMPPLPRIATIGTIYLVLPKNQPAIRSPSGQIESHGYTRPAVNSNGLLSLSPLETSHGDSLRSLPSLRDL